MVTGAASGIGLCLARRFARGGANLAVLDKNGDALSEAFEDIGKEAHWAIKKTCDISDFNRVSQAVREIIEEKGDIDVLVNNAGISARAAFADASVEVFRRVMAVNFFGALHCTKVSLESLIRRKGLIITISSIAGFSPLLGRSAYAASKHALHGLFDSLRTELKNTGVGVMIVCPGFTSTAIGTSALGGDGTVTSHPQSKAGRPARPEDVADRIFRAAQRNKRLLVMTPVGKLARLLTKFSPSLFESLMARAVRSELER